MSNEDEDGARDGTVEYLHTHREQLASLMLPLYF